MKFIEVKENADIEKLALLASEIWHEYWVCILTLSQIDYMVEKFQSYNAIKNQIENEKYCYFLIEDKNEIVGYFGCSNKENYLFLSKLYIKKNFRNSGYGHKAFQKIKELAKIFNKKSIVLTVNKNNINTIKAYEKWGFKTIDSVVNDIGSGFVMDDYILEYIL
ncbi:MAG: GNAT family N-acetyltransferase [Cyanobacteria bacterium SIG29]|nr:GNAT family N-acetyltransferase [Cyanobacteria bacterium SIG29]